MSQRKLLVKDLTLEYDGYFDCAEMFRLVEDWFKEHGYEKKEIKHFEGVREKGRNIEYEIHPYRKISDYVRFDIETIIRVNDMIDTQIKKKGFTFNINKGHVTILISAYLTTDRIDKWEQKAIFFFFRTIFDKFINRKYMEQYESDIMKDVQGIHSELKGYLNLSKTNPPS